MTTISSAAEQVPVTAAPVPRPDVNRKRMARLGWMFSAPALVIIAAVTIFPIVYSVVLSVFNVTVSGNGTYSPSAARALYVQSNNAGLVEVNIVLLHKGNPVDTMTVWRFDPNFHPSMAHGGIGR